MTDPLHHKFHKELSELRLTPEEKAMLRVRLNDAIAARPLHARTPSPYWHVLIARGAYALAVLVLVAGTGGGIAYAAEGSLPGDTLYPVKIHVTEAVQSALAFSPTAKAEVHASLAQRRLEEAQQLAAQGKLNATTTQEIAANLDEHATQVQAIAQALATQDPGEAAQISTQFSSTLAANSAVLQDLSQQKDGGEEGDSDALSAVVHKHVAALSLAVGALLPSNQEDVSEKGKGEKGGGDVARAASGVRTMALKTSSTSSPVSPTTSASSSVAANRAIALGLSSHAKDAYARAQGDFASLKASLDATTSTQVATQLQSVGLLLEQGDASLSVGSVGNAAIDYSQALSQSARLEALLSAGTRFSGSIITPLLEIHAEGQSSSHKEDHDQQNETHSREESESGE